LSLKAQAVSGAKWSGLSTGIVTALHFITLALLARLLSPSDFGLMGMIMVVIGFARVFMDMGISNAIVYRQNITKEELSSLYWLNILAGITVFFIISASAPVIVSFYNEPQLNDLVYLAAVIFLITPVGQQFQILLQKELQFKALAKIEIICSVTNSLTTIILAINGFGVYSLVWGQLAGTSVRAVQLFYIGCKKWKPGWYFSWKGIKTYISFGLYQMGEQTINYFNTNLDYLLIGSFLGAKSLGYYTLAYNLIIRPASMINPIITRVAFPVFSKVQNDLSKLKKGYLKVLELLSLVNFPLMVGFAVVAPVAVPVIFGDQWFPSIILIQILTIVGLLRSTGNPVGSLLLARGRADLGFKWNLALMITQIPGLYIGAKFGGTVGVAIAFAILMCIYSPFNYLILIRKMVGPCLHDYFFSMWPSLWMSAVMGCMIIIIGLLFHSLSQLFLLIILVTSGMIIFCFLLVYMNNNLFSEIKQMVQIPNVD